MGKESEAQWERPDTWDYERPEIRQPVKAPRVVLSVAFRRDDFERVSVYAERMGKRTSEFVREAAIEKASGRAAGTLVYGSGSMGTLWGIELMPVVTLASGSPVEDPGKMEVTTY